MSVDEMAMSASCPLTWMDHGSKNTSHCWMSLLYTLPATVAVTETAMPIAAFGGCADGSAASAAGSGGLMPASDGAAEKGQEKRDEE